MRLDDKYIREQADGLHPMNPEGTKLWGQEILRLRAPTENIIARVKDALNTLTEADSEFAEVKQRMDAEEWNRFTSHMAGWLWRSLRNSEP